MKANNLSTEKSPYLQQHASNPVWWQPWGQAAFDTAQRENKLIFLSIGYSTCHWCHVMEHESFEDNEVANVLNDKFVAIKIDREELPDIDALYMRAVQFMTGQGGWPMSVFLTPDLKPVFGGTYFPREYFLRVLGRLADAWVEQPQMIHSYGDEMIKALKAPFSITSQNAPQKEISSQEVVSAFLNSAAQNFDPQYGGFGAAPKFPAAIVIRALLEATGRSDLLAEKEKAEALRMATISLREMARGGIYDQLGGGFARYSVDERWCVPHFEKMLYDNAGLMLAYLEAFKVTGEAGFSSVTEGIIGYLLEEMVSPEGAFYAAEDADSEGHEGTFYVWDLKEIEEILNEDEFKIFSAAYETPEGGNFEHGKLILHGRATSLWSEKTKSDLKNIESKLKLARSKRIRPFKDKKIITEWNGMAIEAFARAGDILKNPRYVAVAHKAASFIKMNLWNGSEKKLFRRFCDGEVKFDAVLDDYVFLIAGLIALSEVTNDQSWLEWALELQSSQDKLFWDQTDEAYRYSANPQIILPKEFHDGATPNGNGIAALNLAKFKKMGLEVGNTQFESLRKIPAILGNRSGTFGYATFVLLSIRK